MSASTSTERLAPLERSLSSARPHSISGFQRTRTSLRVAAARCGSVMPRLSGVRVVRHSVNGVATDRGPWPAGSLHAFPGLGGRQGLVGGNGRVPDCLAVHACITRRAGSLHRSMDGLVRRRSGRRAKPSKHDAGTTNPGDLAPRLAARAEHREADSTIRLKTDQDVASAAFTSRSASTFISRGIQRMPMLANW
jgi:hypothetical protein